MISHPNTLLAACDIRRNDLLHTAERERLAALASGTWSPVAFGATRIIIGGAGAKLLAFAGMVIATFHPALLPLPHESS